MKTFKLNNGIEIPALGYGVFQIRMRLNVNSVFMMQSWLATV